MNKPSWTIRRRYVFVGFSLGVAMIVTHMVSTLMGNEPLNNDLITGGVALVSLVLGTYVFGAAYENRSKENQDG